VIKTIAPSVGQYAIRDPYTDIKRNCAISDPVIIDGGAELGDSTSRFKSVFQNAQIHAIEPRESAFRQLEVEFSNDDSVKLHKIALGEVNSTLTLNVTDNGGYSSVLDLDKDEAPDGLRSELAVTDVREEESVEVTRLDELVESADILKLDLQGYELEALKSSDDLLSGVSIILTEVHFTPIYNGQPTYCDVAAFLEDRDFKLFNLYDNITRSDGQLIAADALFVRR
jgi:FkbM family methyltransferase